MVVRPSVVNLEGLRGQKAALHVPYSEHAPRLGTSQVVLAADPELLRSQPAAVALLLPLLRPGGRLQAQILQVRRQLELLGLLPASSPMPAVDDGPLIRALAIR